MVRRSKISSERGVSAVEYTLIISLVAVASLFSLQFLSQGTIHTFASAGVAIAGGTAIAADNNGGDPYDPWYGMDGGTGGTVQGTAASGNSPRGDSDEATATPVPRP